MKQQATKIKTFEEFCKSVGFQVLWRYPKSTRGGNQRQGIIVFDQGAANPYGIEYLDIDQSLQREGVWEGQIELGNVEVLLIAKT